MVSLSETHLNYLSTLRGALQRAAFKAAFKVDKKRLVRIMLENSDLDMTFITEGGEHDGKKIHHAEGHKLTEIILDSEPYFVKALDFHQKGNHYEAIEYYNKAIETEPLDARAWNNKGLLLSTMGKHNEAIECFDKALDIAPRMMGGKVWANKAGALEKTGRYEEAVGCYDKALNVK